MARRNWSWGTPPAHERDLRWWRVLVLLLLAAFPWFAIWWPHPKEWETKLTIVIGLIGLGFGMLFQSHRSATRRTQWYGWVLIGMSVLGLKLDDWGAARAIRGAFAIASGVALLVFCELARRSLAPRHTADPEVFS